jgi:hypothetical protein
LAGSHSSTRGRRTIELLGNGRVYRVPPYQRDYSWTEEQWEDLWNDIVDLRGRPDERHYMGALVVEGETDREFLVIDGQQRLATLSILALAVIQRLSRSGGGAEAAANRERATRLRALYRREGPASLVEAAALLNETDNASIRTISSSFAPLNPRGRRRRTALWQCFNTSPTSGRMALR